MEEVIKLNAVDQYNKMFGLETLHPLVSVVDLSEATGYPRHFTLNYGVYALFLKNTKCGDIRYGKQFYDYQEGTVTSFAPGQVTEVNMLEGMQPSASGLLFHPDLIKGTSLGQGIKQYSFFSYSSTEALHLSEDEKEIFLDCLKKIKMEIQRPIDKHSKGLIARNIELLLDYCMRFYERQFITRSAANKDILMKFEALIDDYFQSDKPQTEGLPSVKYFADKVFLSSRCPPCPPMKTASGRAKGVRSVCRKSPVTAVMPGAPKRRELVSISSFPSGRISKEMTAR